jgi:hypothetical protein
MFTTGNQWTIRAGEQNTLYFRLVDLDQASLRYIPGVGPSNQPVQVKVSFPSIMDGQTIDVYATEAADPYDDSIWQVTLADSQIPYSGNVIFSVTEGSITRRFSVVNMLNVEQVGNLNDGSC